MNEMESIPRENKLIKWIKKDYVIIIICLLCLLGCLYTILTIGEYQEQCNQYWETQLEQCECKNYIQEFDTNFSITMNYEGAKTNGNQNTNQDTSR